ncbi:MAG: DinB family protein [Chitinophagaceae bacterium]|nr:DinB family protein [Chitinophagaceae bacterium]
MDFELDKSYEILRRTPAVLRSLLSGISEEWTMSNEGPDSFSPYDVVGHLIHGEKTDWPDRARMILQHGITQTFVPYDRFAMFEESKGKTLGTLLDEFEIVRNNNLAWLESLNLSPVELASKGIHPSFGEVRLDQLLATWVVHDLTHIAQIGRVMAKQYKGAIGPWTEFFRILNF